MKIVAVIPASNSNTDCFNQYLRLLGKQPLISYSILDSIRCLKIDETFVYTEDVQIADIALKFEAQVPFLSQNKLGERWIETFLFQYFDRYEHYPTYLVILHPEVPFRRVGVIEDAIDRLILAPKDTTALISVETSTCRGEQQFTADNNNITSSNHIIYNKNNYIDIIKIMKDNVDYGDKIIPFLLPKTIRITTEDDFFLGNLLFDKYVKMNN